MHNLDIERNYLHSYMASGFKIFGGMNKPFIAASHNFDFIVDTLEDNRSNITIHKTGAGFYNINIFRADDYVYRFIITKTGVDTFVLDA